MVISLKTKFAQCQPAVGQKCSTYRVSIPFPLPASELCKYLCKQMRANQINQIQCTLTTSQWSPSRQTPPFHSLPSHSIASSSKSHWEIYTDGKSERTSFRQSVEVGVGDGRRNVASISLGKLNHKMLLTHRHTSTAHRAHRYTEKKNA